MCNLAVYLTGRVKGLDDGGKTWRDDITKQLQAVAEWQEKRIRIFNPIKYFSYEEKKHKTERQVKEYFFQQMLKCDVVILNANDTNFSIGTAQEVQFAVDHGIPVIAFGTHDMYPWIVEADAQVVFDSMHEVVDYIRDYYL